MKDIKEIINDNNINIRIINSFEEYKRENKIEDKEDDYKYENEKEIKESIKIKINDEFISFNYFYNFKEEGKYKIQYIFNKQITKTVFMFLGVKIY